MRRCVKEYHSLLKGNYLFVVKNACEVEKNIAKDKITKVDKILSMTEKGMITDMEAMRLLAKTDME